MYMGLTRVPPSLLKSDALGYFIPNKISTIERLKQRAKKVARFRGRYSESQPQDLGFWQALLPIAGAYAGRQAAKSQAKAADAQRKAELARQGTIALESEAATKRNLMLLGGVGLGGAILLVAMRRKK